ncbi:MAG: 4Fe-4S dicluster domain-containing protein [Proteobacteria bacterium]|nr:4Fe-4S dicluster domain-containing protein [Pseudomonadota bacterium]
MLQVDSEQVHNFKNRILQLSDVDVTRCIQCGKCSAGCPVAPDMEEMPNQIMRYIQLNLKEKALTSPMVWVCASCVTCSARCPEGVNIARVMNVLRRLCIEEGYQPGQKQVNAFNSLFFDNIKKYGRIYELGLMVQYNMKMMTPFKDIGLFPDMLKKGKINLLPHRIKDIGSIRELFQKSKRFIKG